MYPPGYLATGKVSDGTIENLLLTGECYPPPPEVHAWASIGEQDTWNRELDQDPLAFWRASGDRLVWAEQPRETLVGGLGDARWFVGGRLNATISCLDRHVATYPEAVAYHYLREDGFERVYTYRDLLREVCRLANALQADGVRSGDRVCIYMPLAFEGIVAMLACARIGAVHSVVYAGLGATALRDRIKDAGAEILIGADLTYRRGKEVDLLTILRDAVRNGSCSVRRVVLWRRAESLKPLDEWERDWDTYIKDFPDACEPVIVEASHPLFILYTSGTTGKPKGVVMGHGGYLAGTSALFAHTTDIGPNDVYWCTSDIGWIVGHSLIVYGALANRLSSIIREGSPDYPTTSAVYKTISMHRVTKLYTAPTLARMLMRGGHELAADYDLSSLQAIFCAGEPLNPEAWHFLFDCVGRGRAAVCNQWWQTETGAMILGYLPTSYIRPDRSGKSFGPIEFDVVASNGSMIPRGAGGLLVIRTPWPAMFMAVWGDATRYKEYFDTVPGAYTAGDVATIDDDGYVTVLGRADDVLNVAGHRIATADVESALVSHPACGEAAVIGKLDAIKGEAIKAFVVLRVGHDASDTLRTALIQHVRYHLGPIGSPTELEFVRTLPKTRSGKIMRRLLKAKEAGDDLGDTTTLDE